MYRVLISMGLACLLLCAPAARATDYAVLISAGRATTDDAAYNSCFWYNPYLQYMTLLDEGYSPDNVYFLYGFGTDFNSIHECYQPPEPVTDYAVSRANIQSVFTTLAGIMNSDDFLYVWWMGHGGFIGGYYAMSIMTTGEYVYGYEIEDWMDPIDYDVRTFSWMTCHSGGILDYLEGPQSIVMSSSTAAESTYDDWLCDTWHAEFHYPERCAWAWETPCNICPPPIDADTDDNGRVSFDEAFVYAYDHTTMSTPQIRDLGGLAPDTYLSTGELICDGIGDDTWDGCRGNGCAVCEEKLVGYDCYFDNHLQCYLNTTCAFWFFDCDAACPEPTEADRCVCDGIGDNTWDGCRGNGCAVCREKVWRHDCYFENHPECELNTTCAGQFYDCDRACPAPTKYDYCVVCDGFGDGTWDGCRGNGCAVCAEKLVGYDCYFKRHPQCELNETCGGLFFDCDAACPAPTRLDRCLKPIDKIPMIE